jgi:hypothetical protein
MPLLVNAWQSASSRTLRRVLSAAWSGWLGIEHLGGKKVVGRFYSLSAGADANRFVSV